MPIPEITPEKGDIVEGEGGVPFYYHPEKTYTSVKRVLARKPKEFEEAQADTHNFIEAWSYANNSVEKQAAYKTFLRAILGGAEYALLTDKEGPK